MENLSELLLGQVSLSTNYFYIRKTKEIIDKRTNKIVFPTYDLKHITLLTFDNSLERFPYKRILCYIEDKLPLKMKDIFDQSFQPLLFDGVYRWITKQANQMLGNVLSLREVYNTHPELLLKNGYYEEGIIPFKGRDGFYIVPYTNATIALNPDTHEVISTYSGETLVTQYSERGDVKYCMNKRLSLRGTFFLHRALACLFIPVPEKYRVQGLTLEQIIRKLEVDHVDGDPKNYSIENLQWLSKTENLIKKIDQGQCGVSDETIWLSPEGEEMTFRSMARASRTIGCEQRDVYLALKGWRNVPESIFNGWKLLTPKIHHWDEDIFQKIERSGIDRAELTSYKKAGVVLITRHKNKEFIIYKDLITLCDSLKVPLGTIEGRLRIRGPFRIFDNSFILPARLLDYIAKLKVFEML